jgi:K+ transporter
MKIIAVLLILVILVGAITFFILTIPQREVKKVLKDEFDNQIEIIDYRKKYNWSNGSLPKTVGFSTVYLHDKKEEINFMIGHTYKEDQVGLVDSPLTIKKNINHSKSSALSFTNKLKNKAQKFKKISERDFFVKHHSSGKYQIIIFAKEKQFSFSKKQEFLAQAELYLAKNTADNILVLPKEYKQYFTDEIKRGYFRNFEVNNFLKAENIKNDKIVTSAFLGHQLNFYQKVYQIDYVDQKIKITEKG